MLFVQFRFLIFFLIVFSVHWLLQTNRSRKIWLLCASHFFFACFFIGGADNPAPEQFPPYTFFSRLFSGQSLPVGWWYPVVMWVTTTLDYFVGRKLAVTDDAAGRVRWLLLSLCANLGVLAFFKYANFGLASASAFLAWLGLPASEWTLKIFLPTGISFYTFQSMSYSIDVYRRRLEPVKSLLDYATYIAFFPQLVAGPIVRALSFLPQLSELRVWRSVDVRAALTLFFIGFVKKACLSENVAPVVDAYFADPGRFDVASAFIAVFFYATQIYCDFSGYSDMAIACAALLGYQLTINFNYPYLAANITEFWRRWHISLSTWLRDYLYIPLGGNRGSKLFTYRNLMLTMLIGGLWHGAAWTFVVWGGMHGLALIVHREYDRIASGAGAVWQKIRSYAGPVVCFYFVCITWVLFRAQPIVDRATGEVKTGGFEAAMMILKSFILLQPNGGRQVVAEMGWCFVAFGLLAAIHAMASRKMFATWWRRLPDWGYAAALGAGVSLALFFVPQKFKAFIYFQF